MKRVIEIFRDKEELNRLVNTPNPKYKSGIRSRAILALLSFAGLRVSELVNLRPEDIRENDNCIYINNSKYHSSRVVYIPGYVFVYIKNW
jgi:integrase